MAPQSTARKRAAQTKKRQQLQKAGGLALLLLGALVIVFFGFRSPEAAAVTPTGNTGTGIGDLAPDFSVPTLDGQVYTLSEQRGKPTLVFFMAYWCGTCIPEGQALARLQQEYGDQLNIIAIDVDPSSSVEVLAQFKSAAGDGAFTWAFDAGQQVTQAYAVRSLDTTLLLNENGIVVYRDDFPSPYKTLKDALAEAGF